MPSGSKAATSAAANPPSARDDCVAAANSEPSPDTNAAVVFANVGVNLGGVQILERVNARVPRGGCTAVVGPNGAGKTTLLMAMLGQVPHTGGITIAKNEVGRDIRVGYVPQKLTFDRGMPITVSEFLAAGFQRRPFWFGVGRRHRETTAALLAQVGAEQLANRRLGELSGGESRRVLLALAMAIKPQLLVLDEPAAGVDVRGGQVFCELLERLGGEMGFTQLMVSHDLSTVTHHATHVICLNRTVVAEGPPRLALSRETLAAVFGLHLGLVDSRSLPEGASGKCDAQCCRGDGNNQT